MERKKSLLLVFLVVYFFLTALQDRGLTVRDRAVRAFFFYRILKPSFTYTENISRYCALNSSLHETLWLSVHKMDYRV